VVAPLQHRSGATSGGGAAKPGAPCPPVLNDAVGPDTDDLEGLLRPYEASRMKRYPVSTRVNLVKNDDPECAMEVEEQLVTA
jgi:hypothetical protein